MKQFNNHTPLPWNICWGAFNGHKTHFSICDDKHGSSRPVVECENDWTGGLGKWESKELEGNAAFIVEACNNYYQLKAKADMVEDMVRLLKEALPRICQNLPEPLDAGTHEYLSILENEIQNAIKKAGE